jgi:hypothetical protein
MEPITPPLPSPTEFGIVPAATYIAGTALNTTVGAALSALCPLQIWMENNVATIETQLATVLVAGSAYSLKKGLWDNQGSFGSVITSATGFSLLLLKGLSDAASESSC